jgi:hypothetical protein
MSDELHRTDAVVALRDDLDDTLRKFHAAAGAELAGFEVLALPMPVNLLVDGAAVEATIELAVADNTGAYLQVVMQHNDRENGGTHYYVASRDETEDWRPGQYRLVTDETDFPLTVDTYKLITS